MDFFFSRRAKKCEKKEHCLRVLGVLPLKGEYLEEQVGVVHYCLHCDLDYEQSPFFLRDSRTSETRARVKVTPHEKGESRRGERI